MFRRTAVVTLVTLTELSLDYTIDREYWDSE